MTPIIWNTVGTDDRRDRLVQRFLGCVGGPAYGPVVEADGDRTLPELHLRGPSLLVTVGPAASGKSTLLRRLHADGVVDVVVSTDAVRGELGLHPAETGRTYAETRRRVSEGLGSGLVVAADATNLRRSDRHAWRRLARAASASLAAVRIGEGLTVDDLVARDARRDRHVPHDAIREHLERFATTASPDVLRSEGLVFVDAGAPIVRCGVGCPAHGTDVALVDVVERVATAV